MIFRFMHCPAAAGQLVALTLFLGCGLGMGAAAAQERPPDEGPFETIQIRPNVYVIFGAGGNITAHVGEDGVILVDSGRAEMAERVIEALQAITPRPVRLIVNTSADLDHVGGNEGIGRTGVAINPDGFSDEESATVLAHENVLLYMSGGADEKLYPTSMWPTETYTARVRSLYVNEDAVQVIRRVGATTDGNSVVLFRRADVIATGDVLDLRHFPKIDPARGGTIQGELDALNHLLELTVPAMPLVGKPGRTLLVPGHGRVSDYAELVEYRDMLTTIRDIIKDYVDQGMTLEQVQQANPTAGYRARWGRDAGPWTTDMFVEAVYNELKAAPQGTF